MRPAGRLRANMGYRSARPKEKATAEAFQESLGKVGIKLTLKPLPDDTYTSEQCGKPSYLVANKMGLCTYSWGADWNTGYGYLAQLVDSRTINPEGGAPNFAVRLPAVDKLIDQLALEQDDAKRAAISTRSTSWSWRARPSTRASTPRRCSSAART